MEYALADMLATVTKLDISPFFVKFEDCDYKPYDYKIMKTDDFDIIREYENTLP